MKSEIGDVQAALAGTGYVAEREIATAVYLALELQRPLLVEGAAGVGKTEIAKALAAWLDTDLIRLQCYEGLDVHAALYEWNYQKQLLRIRLHADESAETLEHEIFGPEFLLERPLLRSIRSEKRPVLLIDEIDRADEEFEAFLLELLSDFQVSIPELGTISARERPIVVLTSNGTRELSDALRRRCLYLWIDYPGAEKELEILRRRVPELDADVARSAVRLAQGLRGERLAKTPGVAETLDFALALEALGGGPLDAAAARDAIGALIKDPQDLRALTAERLAELLGEAPGADGP